MDNRTSEEYALIVSIDMAYIALCVLRCGDALTIRRDFPYLKDVDPHEWAKGIIEKALGLARRDAEKIDGPIHVSVKTLEQAQELACGDLVARMEVVDV